jgi:hypothetical protein
VGLIATIDMSWDAKAQRWKYLRLERRGEMNMPVNGAFCYEDSIIINRLRAERKKTMAERNILQAEVKQLKELCRKNHICLCTFHDYLAGKHCDICGPDRNP